jgi:hypothetical protein
MTIRYSPSLCDSESPTMAQAEWISALRLSTMWELLDIRALAIKALSELNMSAVDKVTLARECKVTEWLLVGYEEIAKREKTITNEEAERLGWQAAFRLLRARETSKKSQPYPMARNYGNPRADLGGNNWTESLRAEFAMEIRELEDMSPSNNAE